ncbi:jacalin-like lectin [Pseudooctadecabacter jejudonensis]|uniref:Jacalin-like lectin domain protein n=1 Tax=Pseudooctadecabacter jejudonensis TaxID=1391910 RepID=A0A1Y5SHL5_9RHOB|nr:jacalin-like lectin [Pseudooctadecabacter jejudonensis]SLN40986.1 Jacalin-like lectin domain protein [Pseudooctadecabacter jejudonensis]
MSDLIFPVSVNAWRLTRPRQVVGPPTDYEILPWFDGVRDHNASTANVASAVNAPPFGDHSTWLDAGVHLHWTLPKPMTRGASRRTEYCTVQVGDMWLPPAPNRWLIRREAEGQNADQYRRIWIVESDYVHPGVLRPNTHVVAYPRANRDPHDPPFLYLGRQFELDVKTLEPSPDVVPMTQATSLDFYGPDITAVGPGDPLFAAHYPSCRSIFGLHDDAPPPEDVAFGYGVFGWYEDGAKDPTVRAVTQGFRDIVQNLSQVAGIGSLDAKQDLGELGDRLSVYSTLGRELGLDSGDGKILAVDPTGARTLVAGSVGSEPDTPLPRDMPAETASAPDLAPIGIGSSAAEAFAALVTGGTPGPNEDALVQGLAATDLTAHPLDHDLKLREARHSEQFKAVRGHGIWTLRPNQAAEGEGTAGLEDLSDDLAVELDALNRLQEAYGARLDEIDSLRQGVFSDWSRFMRAAYPESDSDIVPFDLNAAEDLLVRTQLAPLEALLEKTGTLYMGESPKGDMLVTAQAPQAQDAVAVDPFAYGEMHGAEGAAYSFDAAAVDDRIAEIRIAYGEIIDSLQIVTADAGPLTRRGGPTGNKATFTLQLGEYITKIEGSTGPWRGHEPINHIRFTTNFGRTSRTYGSEKTTGKHFLLQAPPGHFICGLRMRSATYTEAIGIVVTPDPRAGPVAETPPPSSPYSLAAQIVGQHARVLAHLQGDHGADLHLGITPGPRFWRPNDPVVVLDDTQTRAPDRTNGVLDDGMSSFYLVGDRDWSHAVGKVIVHPGLIEYLCGDDAKIVFNWVSAAADWAPVQLEWQAEIRAEDDHNTEAHSAYPTDLVTKSYTLQQDHADLVARNKTILAEPHLSYLSGRSVLNPSAGRLIAERYKGLSSALTQGTTPLKGTPVVLPLGGFHDHLLMHTNEPQLTVDDPVGLPEQRALAQRIRRGLGGFHPVTPASDQPFHPLRSGEVTLTRLRAVDAFGRTRSWRPKVLHTTARMTPAPRDIKRATARLPVRLSQPARLTFRWLSAGHADLESNAHPASSPICGWLLPNDYDGSIAVYDRAGHMLGGLIEGATWVPAPGRARAPRSWREVPDRTLARIIGWMTRDQSSTSDFTEALLTTLDAGLNMVDPMAAAQAPARALLIGRPIAVTRARLRLSTQHAFATDQSDQAFMARLEGSPAATKGFENVHIPVRLGEHGQLNDGLCGYWIETDDGFADDTLHLPQGLVPPKAHARIAAYDGAGGTTLPLTLSLSGGSVDVTMLFDPLGRVHATTGVLPTKSIAMLPELFEPAMNKLRATFRTAPLLTPADAIEIPLPSEPGSSWSWLHRDGDIWTHIPHHPSVPRAAFLSAFGTVAPALWEALVESGRFVRQDGPDTALLMPSTTGQPIDFAAFPDLTPASLERGLHALTKGIDPPSMRDQGQQRPILRQGWLELRQTPTPPGAKTKQGGHRS